MGHVHKFCDGAAGLKNAVRWTDREKRREDESDHAVVSIFHGLAPGGLPLRKKDI